MTHSEAKRGQKPHPPPRQSKKALKREAARDAEKDKKELKKRQRYEGKPAGDEAEEYDGPKQKKQKRVLTEAEKMLQNCISNQEARNR